jgi:O-antigen/teichoic acid export membrane protein
MVAWFKDLLFLNLLRNASWLVGGNIAAAFLGLIEITVKTRMLGAAQFGLLAVIIAYVALIQQFASFQSWQALIKYGAEALRNDEQVAFMSKVKLSFLLDIFGAVTGTVIAVGGGYILVHMQIWEESMRQLVIVYSFSLLFNLSGTPIGILRLLDRFDVLVIQNLVTSLLALTGTLVVYFSGGGIREILIVLLLTSILGNVFLVFMSFLALKKRKLMEYWWAPITKWKPYLRFSAWTYVSSTLDIPVKQLDIIIVSLVVSLQAAGIYKISKQVVSLLGMLSDAIYQAVYPQFASMIANHAIRDAFNYVKKVGSLLFVGTGVPALLLAATSFWWLGAIFGESFAVGAVPLSIYLCLKVFAIGAVAIHPLFTAMGFVKQNTIILLFSNSIYLIAAYILGSIIGLNGVNFAYGMYLALVLLLKFTIIRNEVGKQAGSSV